MDPRNNKSSGTHVCEEPVAAAARIGRARVGADSLCTTIIVEGQHRLRKGIETSGRRRGTEEGGTRTYVLSPNYDRDTRLAPTPTYTKLGGGIAATESRGGTGDRSLTGMPSLGTDCYIFRLVLQYTVHTGTWYIILEQHSIYTKYTQTILEQFCYGCCCCCCCCWFFHGFHDKQNTFFRGCQGCHNT